MTLSELLDTNLILPGITCASKDELISKLVERLYAAGRGLPVTQKEMLDTIYKREQIGGTLLPSGLSVPHARLENFENFIIGIATPAESLSHNGHEIRLMALMITSQSGRPHYLEVLAAMTKISKNGECFSGLCEAESAEDFLRIIRGNDLELS